MNQKTMKTAVLVAGCLLSACVVGFAQFGGIVSDPGMYVRMSSEYTQMVNLVRQTSNTYSVLQNAARNVTGKDAWIPTMSTWQTPVAANTYGNTAGWISATKTGTGAVPAYGAVTQPLQPYGPAWSSYDATTQADLARRYGLVQVTDGVTAAALGQNGAIRQSAIQSQSAIRQVESDSASADPSKNTQAALLNMSVATGVIQARQQTQTNQALTSIVDMQAAELAARRNEAVAEINDDINSRTAHAAIAAQHGGSSAALRGFRPQ